MNASAVTPSMMTRSMRTIASQSPYPDYSRSQKTTWIPWIRRRAKPPISGAQSPNAIIDTACATKFSDTSIIRKFRRLAPLTRSANRVIAIAESGD